jgi:hypothetical protein
MKESELQIAINWAHEEGWNPGLHDASCFYQADSQGFFIGLLDGEPIAVGSAVIYSDNFAFCGLYIVKQEFRKQGYGLSLTKERLNYTGNRVTGIDGVLANISIYERLGYAASHKQIRYEWTGSASHFSSPRISDLRRIPFQQLEEFDRDYFQAPRPAFLRSWIDQANGYALGYLQDQRLKGYGVIRKCFVGHKIRPLFAESPAIAQALFEALCAKVSTYGSNQPIYLDIPELNKNALTLVKDNRMTPKFEVIRMYRNGFPDLNLNEGIYGVTTFELG